MHLSDELIAELELLTLFNLDNHLEGLKVHQGADPRRQAAVQRLHAEGLTSQADGGYLTSLGRDAAEHAQALLTILQQRSTTPA